MMKKFAACFTLLGAALLAGCASAPVDNTQLASSDAKQACVAKNEEAIGSHVIHRSCDAHAAMSQADRDVLNDNMRQQGKVCAAGKAGVCN